MHKGRLNKPSAPKFDFEKWAAKYSFDPNGTKKEKEMWFRQEQEYWIDGRFGFTGEHYFAMTQAFFEKSEGGITRPVWRDADDDIYGGYHDAKSRFCDYLVLKRREIGLSAIFGGVIPIHTALCYPGSTAVLTSADKTRLEQLYKRKLMILFDNLDSDFRPGTIARRQWGYLHMGKQARKTDPVSGLDSIVVVRDTVEDPTSLEAYRARHIFIDEFFLHPKADRVARSAQASIKAGFKKLAPIVLGGSAGESTLEGQKRGIEMWNNAENLDIVTMFMPAWKGIMEAPEYDETGKLTGKLLNFCPNGHSDEKLATEWIMKTREKLDKLEDKSYIESFIKQYPLTVDEVFSVVGVGQLPADIMNVIKKQERVILATKPQIEKVDLAKDPEGDIKIIPNPEGKILMLERPKQGHEYIAGTDPIPFNTNEMIGSDQATVIKDIETGRYVCMYKERDVSPDVIVKNQILMQELYFGAPTMLEINRGGVIKDRYVSENKEHLLARKPTLIGKGLASNKTSFGYYKNDWTTQRGLDYLFSYLREHWDDIWFMEIIDELKVFMTANTDFVDAMMSCEIYQKHLLIKKQKGRQKVVVRRKSPRLVFESGRWIKRWE